MIAKEDLKHIKKVLSLNTIPEKLIYTILGNLEYTTLKKGTIFSSEGEIQNRFFFLKSGIARAFVVDNRGKEFTRSLFKAPAPLASIKALITETKAEISFQCLTNCEFYIGNYKEFINLTKSSVQIASLYCKLLEYSYLEIEDRVYELSLPAKEKYELLRKRIPGIDNLIPQYQIATYLNITPVQLSRIRKNGV